VEKPAISVTLLLSVWLPFINLLQSTYLH